MLSLYMIAFGEMLWICIFNRLLGIFFNNDSGVSVDRIAAFGVFGGFLKTDQLLFIIKKFLNMVNF